MTTFQDGPAAEQSLSLYRTPYLLRVTELCRPGNDAFDDTVWDALDQPDDEPRSGERIHVYVLIEGPFRGFVRSSKPGAGGLQVLATYKLSPIQPADADMRTRDRWVSWCEANAESLGWRKPA